MAGVVVVGVTVLAHGRPRTTRPSQALKNLSGLSGDEDTGAPSQFEWLNDGVAWYLHETTPGNITKESPYSYYYEVNLGITTATEHATSYPLKGKLTVNAMRADGATFAAIQEGTGTAWLVADGTLTNVIDEHATPIT
jgi:hypothetical protein